MKLLYQSLHLNFDIIDFLPINLILYYINFVSEIKPHSVSLKKLPIYVK